MRNDFENEMRLSERQQQLHLVRAARNGDETAFDRLYLMVEGMLRRSLFRIVPPGDLDDVVQDTMINAFRKLDQFREESSFSTWCVSIGRNTALMRCRKLKREASVIAYSLDQPWSFLEGEKRSFPEPGYEDGKIEQNLFYGLIQRKLRSTPEVHRVAILMQLRGSSVQEIALELNKSVPAVKAILFRGKRALGARIAAEHVKRGNPMEGELR